MKKKWVITGVVAGVLGVGYGIGCYYFSQHFFPNTTINERDVSMMTSLEAEETLLVLDQDDLVVTGRDDSEEKIALKDIDYEVSFEDGEIADTLGKQNIYAWVGEIFQQHDDTVEPNITFDSDKLEEEISTFNILKVEDMVAPVNAYIDIVDGDYEIVPEVMGTELDLIGTVDAIKETLDEGLLNLDLTETDCYSNPEVKANDESFVETFAKLDQLNREVITIDVMHDTYTMSADELLNIAYVGEDGSIHYDDGKLNDFVSMLNDKYGTYNTSRQFTTHYGNEISIGGAGNDTYGFLMNWDSTKASIAGAITSGASQTVQTYWDLSGQTRNSSNGDIGNTYIEVSIYSQHLWVYMDGNMVYEADVITGLPQHGQDTPTGVFRIWSKQTNVNLKGTAWNGETWDSPVSFWMPIDWTGVGLHDASWQSAFGGTLYYTRGSHGCINLSYSVAQWIYNNCPLNMPVIVYY